ncbi:unnamed protein product [Rotaria sp. Silwood2]|nr:unnamed protein product [Rotaria sp. Silwood2]
MQKAIIDFSEALRLYDESKQKAQALKFEIYYKRAWTHHVLGELDKAESDYSELIGQATPPKEWKAILSKSYLGRGLVYESKHLLQKALKDIERAKDLLQEKSSYYEYCYEKVIIALKKTRVDLVEEEEDVNDVAQKSQAENKTSHENSERGEAENDNVFTLKEIPREKTTQQLQKDNYQCQYYKALLLSEQGDNKAALEFFTKAFNNTTDKDEKAECLFRQGLCQYQLKNKVEAQLLFQQVLEYEPKHARTMFRIGMIQTTDMKHKEALENFNKAHKYSPNSADILYERAKVFEKLGHLDSAMYDRRRAMQLGQSFITSIIMLEDRLRYFEAESLQQTKSSSLHLKMAWVQDVLHYFRKSMTFFQKEDGKLDEKSHQDKQTYRRAVEEYRIAINCDSTHQHPEAWALLAICHRNEKDVLLAHQTLEELFENFTKKLEYIRAWEAFIRNTKKDSYWNEMGAVPSDETMIEIKRMETTRRMMSMDENLFQGPDKKNLLLFYKRFRTRLSNVLVAFALAGCEEEVVKHNLQGSLHT